MKNKFYIQQLNPTKDELAKITDLPKFAKEELTPSQIIVFASLYPAFKDTKENEWFSKFSQLPEVATGIKTLWQSLQWKEKRKPTLGSKMLKLVI